MGPSSDGIWKLLTERASAKSVHALTGTLHWSIDSEDKAEPRGGKFLFWFQDPVSWRVEDSQGIVNLTNEEYSVFRDSGGALQRLGRGAAVKGSPASPRRLLQRKLIHGYDLADGVDPTRTTLAGRPCYTIEAVLKKDPSHRVTLVADEDTGLVLSLTDERNAFKVKVVDLLVNQPIDPSQFVVDSPVRADWQTAQLRKAEIVNQLESADLPVPRWWPSGPAYRGVGATDSGESWCIELQLPGTPLFMRLRQGEDFADVSGGRFANRNVASWTDGNVQYFIGSVDELNESDIEKIKDSIRPT